jgi:integrase
LPRIALVWFPGGSPKGTNRERWPLNSRRPDSNEPWELAVPKLTKRLVDAARANVEKGELFLWDSELRGFGVRLKPSGVKSFVLKYRVGGQTKRHTISKVGSPYTVDEAREIAADLLRDIRKGADPAVAKAQARDGLTVADMCEWYLEQAGKGAVLSRRGERIKASTLAMDRTRISAHVLPLIGRRKVENITLDDIEKFQIDVAAGKTAKQRYGRGGATTGGTGAASRSVGMLRTIFEHAKRKKLVKENPAVGAKKYADGRQRRFLALDEIAALGAAILDAEVAGGSQTGLAGIRFLLMTGLRRMEALALPWAWVDARAHCIRFEDTKSGAQLRPIGVHAVRMLESLPRRKGCPWVFPAERGDGHFVGLPKVLERMCRRAGLEGVTVHVLRHSFAAVAAEMGFSELTIAGLLGHTVASVTGRYAHVPDRALASAAHAVAARIAAALDGWEEGAKVVKLRERG